MLAEQPSHGNMLKCSYGHEDDHERGKKNRFVADVTSEQALTIPGYTTAEKQRCNQPEPTQQGCVRNRLRSDVTQLGFLLSASPLFVVACFVVLFFGVTSTLA